MFSEADHRHIEWLRLKSFQARERLEAAYESKNATQADALLDLVEGLGDCCVRSVCGLVHSRYDIGESTVTAREVRAMARDIIDVAWEVDEALTVISEFLEHEEEK